MSKTFFIAMPRWDSQNPVSRQFQALAQALADRGHQVIVLVPPRKNNSYPQTGSLKVYSWPSQRPTKLKDAIFLFRLIRQFHPDCLIANFAADNWMMVVGWLLKVSVRIVWYHTMYAAPALDLPRNKFVAEFLRLRKSLVYKLATHIVPVSHAAAKDIQHYFSVPKKKCTVFHNLLADPYNGLLEKSVVQENVITCVGRLEFSKGQDVLIQAMSLLKTKHPNLRLHLIGDGRMKTKLIELAVELDVAGNINFLGEIPHEKVLKELASSFASVVPSRDEAFGLVVIESLAVGTPVIASKIGGIVEIISDYKNGFLVAPGSSEELANAIQIAIDTPELRTQLSNTARNIFLDKFELIRRIHPIANWLENIIK